MEARRHHHAISFIFNMMNKYIFASFMYGSLSVLVIFNETNFKISIYPYYYQCDKAYFVKELLARKILRELVKNFKSIYTWCNKKTAKQ
jgi:hypothetical protein